MSTYNPDDYEGRTPDLSADRPAAHSPDDFQMETHEGREHTGAGAAAREAGRDLASAAKDMGRDLVTSAREEGRSLMEAQKGRLAEKLGHVGSALEEAAQKLEHEGDPNIARYASAMAGHLHRAGDYIERRDPADFYADADSLARRRPELVFGAMFLAGLSLARFIKASGSRARNQREAQLEEESAGRRYARTPYAPDYEGAEEWRPRSTGVFTTEEQ